MNSTAKSQTSIAKFEEFFSTSYKDDVFKILEKYPDERSLNVDYEALERDRRLQGAMLEVRRKYGANAVFKGMNMLEGATTLERNMQIGGHKA